MSLHKFIRSIIYLLFRGFITIGVCESLCNVMADPRMSETGRDAAACALGILTHMVRAISTIRNDGVSVNEPRLSIYLLSDLSHH